MRNFERQANRIVANRSKQKEEEGTRREKRRSNKRRRIRSLESPTNMSASSVPEGVIDRLRFLDFRLLPAWIQLRNISQDKFRGIIENVWTQC